MKKELKNEEKLFPEYLVSDSVNSDEELQSIFKKYPDISREYLAIAVAKPEIRNWYENQWPKVKRFLDKDFLSQFKKEEEHDARAWEFHLASVFLKNNLVLREKDWEFGPDFCINVNGRKIWVEAIVCSRGIIDPVPPKPDMKPGIVYSFGGNIEDTNRPRALRITNAVTTKFIKYKNKYKDNIVSEKDLFVIAVNGKLIQHHSRPDMLIRLAALGQGPDVLIKRSGQKDLEGGFYKPVDKIKKEPGEKEKEIPLSLMENESLSDLSGIIYCGDPAYNSWINGREIGDDFFFIPHSKPNKNIPEEIFNFCTIIKKNPETKSIETRPFKKQ